MRISTRTRYALRFLVRLALDGGREPLTLGLIARRERISPKYLSRLVIPLTRSGMVKSFPGPRGGYRLARRPERIGVLTVARLFDGAEPIVPCLGRQGLCGLESGCRTRSFWRSLDRGLRARMSRTTIRDIADGRFD